MAHRAEIHILVERRVAAVIKLLDDLLDVVRARWDLGLSSVAHDPAAGLERKLCSDGLWLVPCFQRPDVLESSRKLATTTKLPHLYEK